MAAESIVVIRENNNNDDNNNNNGAAAIANTRTVPVSKTHLRIIINNNNTSNSMFEGKLRLTSSVFVQRLGFQDFFSPQVWRSSMAELVGTAILVFMIDTVVISSFETHTNTPNIIISFFVAFIVTILLLATFPISGGHINPVITISAVFKGLISFPRALIYVLAQCIGAIFGALALQTVVSDSISSNFSLGGCTLTVIAPGPNGPTSVGLDTNQALWLEIFCTFIFLFPVLMAFDQAQAKALGPIVLCSIIGIVVGLIVFVSTTVTTKRGYSGAGINPARCFGPAIVRGGHLWTGHWVFWAGPIISCVLFYLYSLVISAQPFKAGANNE